MCKLILGKKQYLIWVLAGREKLKIHIALECSNCRYCFVTSCFNSFMEIIPCKSSWKKMVILVNNIIC